MHSVLTSKGCCGHWGSQHLQNMDSLPHGCPWQHKTARTHNHCPNPQLQQTIFLSFWTVFWRAIIALPCDSRDSGCDGESLRLKTRELQDLRGRGQLQRVIPLVRSGARGNTGWMQGYRMFSCHDESSWVRERGPMTRSHAAGQFLSQE